MNSKISYLQKTAYCPRRNVKIGSHSPSLKLENRIESCARTCFFNVWMKQVIVFQIFPELCQFIFIQLNLDQTAISIHFHISDSKKHISMNQ